MAVGLLVACAVLPSSTVLAEQIGEEEFPGPPQIDYDSLFEGQVVTSINGADFTFFDGAETTASAATLFTMGSDPHFAFVEINTSILIISFDTPQTTFGTRFITSNDQVLVVIPGRLEDGPPAQLIPLATPVSQQGDGNGEGVREGFIGIRFAEGFEAVALYSSGDGVNPTNLNFGLDDTHFLVDVPIPHSVRLLIFMGILAWVGLPRVRPRCLFAA